MVEGSTGFVVLGGYLADMSHVLDAKQGAAEIDVVGRPGALRGIIRSGDRFRVATEEGAPMHTVGGDDWYVTDGDRIPHVCFQPALESAVHKSVLHWRANAVIEVSRFTLHEPVADQIDTTVKGAGARACKPGVFRWAGTVTCELDNGDAAHAQFGDDLRRDVAKSVGLVLQYGDRTWYGYGLPRERSRDVGRTLYSVVLDFSGDAPTAPQWRD